jgi:hypothetical protein
MWSVPQSDVPQSPFLWSRGTAARETLRYLDTNGHSDPRRMGFFEGTYRNVRLADDDGHTEGRNIYGSPDEGPMVRILLPPTTSHLRT